MKSRTSFFNLTLYKKDITRFAPLWILYTVIMMLIMLSVVGSRSLLELKNATYLVDDINESLAALSVMNLFYGLMAAQLLFGELFNTRLCNALHAMPVRRETRFGSHVIAGLTFSIVPNLLVAVLMMSSLQIWWYTALLWVLVLTLQYLFFFGVAVLAMLCTGNRFAAVLVYAIVNFISMAALWFSSVIFMPLMPGVILDFEPFALFSPVVKMCILDGFFEIDAAVNTFYFTWGTGWTYLWVCAGIGAAVLAGALLLYRRRALECAGDFMAVKLLKPVFLVLYTLCVGAFLAVFGSLFGGDTYLAFLIVGFAVGFFTGKMLLERTVRIFNLKSLLQLGILVALMWLSLQAVQFDVFYIVRYVPDPDAVKEAEVVSYFSGRIPLTTSDPLELEQLTKAHELALQEEGGCKHGDRQSYRITYHMKDGRTVKREYRLCRQEEASQEFEKLFRSPEAIFGYKGHWDDYARSVTSIHVQGMVRQKEIDPDKWINFLDYLYYDCTQGYLTSERGGNLSRYEVTIWNGEYSVYLQLRENSTAYDWLVAYEKADMQQYLKSVTEITLDGLEIGQEHYKDLLTAIYEDCRDHTIYWNDDYENMNAQYVVKIKTGFQTPVTKIYIPEYAENTIGWTKKYFMEEYG